MERRSDEGIAPYAEKGEGITKNAPAGMAEAVESAAQNGAEGASVDNENARINNENAQIEAGSDQEAEKPDLRTVQTKAAQGLDKLTDAELQVYTEYMQQQVEQSENSPGYADNLKTMLREGLADAQTEAQRRTEAAAATEASGTQGEQGSSQAEQGEYTGESGTKYSKEQADALSKLSSDTLIGGAEAQFTMPIDRLGITEEQADALRKAGLLATETQEDGDTFEYLPDVYIFDERSRRFEQQSEERLRKAAGGSVGAQQAETQTKGRQSNADSPERGRAWKGGNLKRTYIEYSDIAAFEKAFEEKAKSLAERNKIIKISDGEIAQQTNNADWSNLQKAREYIRRTLQTLFGNDSVYFEENGTSIEAYLTKEGRKHTAGVEINQEKAAAIAKAKDLIKNAEYVFSSNHDEHSESGKNVPSNTVWDYFEAVVEMGGNPYIVRFTLQDTNRDSREHIYKIGITEEGVSPNNRGPEEARLVDHGETPSKDSILQSDENSNPQNENAAKGSADPEEVKENLLAFGTAKMTNDTGEYKLTIREKYKAGRFLATVERDGKRLNAKTFASEREAAEWAVGVAEGQTRARTDAELDRHKSEKKKGPGITEALFGQVDPEKEAIRQKENKAADAATQTLRERLRRTQEEINALNRLERTTGMIIADVNSTPIVISKTYCLTNGVLFNVQPLFLIHSFI